MIKKTVIILFILNVVVYSQEIPDKFSQLKISQIRKKKFNSTDIDLKDINKRGEGYFIYNILYKSENLKISGLLGIPQKGKKKYPGIVICHGYYPPDNYYAGMGTMDTVEELTSRGFLTLMTDYRGYGKSDGSNSYNIPGEIYDVINAYYSLKKLKMCSGQIGIIGYSWGGGFAAAAAECIKDVKCLVDYYGQLGGMNIRKREYEFLTELGLSDSVILQLFYSKSPLYNAGYIECPVLIHHGDKDKSVPLSQSTAFYNILKSSGKQADLKIYKGFPHAFGDTYKNKSWESTISFLKKYLK